MIATTNQEVLAHTMAIARPRHKTERRIAELEDRIKRLADRHRMTDSMDQIADTVKTIRRELGRLPHDSLIDPTIVMEDIKHELETSHIPVRRFNL